MTHTLFAALPDTIATEHLTLVTPERAHIPALAKLANNKRLHAVLSRVPYPYSQEDGHNYVEAIARSDSNWDYAITLPEKGFIGVIGFHAAPGAWPTLGYWLGEPFWGKGLTEAAQALAAAAHATGTLAGLRSRALTTNAGSINVLHKTGFVETGTGVEPDGNLAGQMMVHFRLEFSAP